ncbi:MAG: transglycosylase SLT domain-containing protein [Bdellovibrionaceae bacterium]|nr:transglycosylase SLT domain-containing protein [Pseudobdellovibrionaceae bacterium]
MRRFTLVLMIASFASALASAPAFATETIAESAPSAAEEPAGPSPDSQKEMVSTEPIDEPADGKDKVPAAEVATDEAIGTNSETPASTPMPLAAPDSTSPAQASPKPSINVTAPEVQPELSPPAADPVPPVVTPGKPARSGFVRFFRRFFGLEKDEEKTGAEPPETEDSQAGTPDLLTPEGDTGSPSEEVLSEEYRSASRAWEAPEYSGQERALDWSPETFQVPAGLRARVDFWKAIYSRYSTHQGVLHDSVHLHVIYQPIDFTEIMKEQSLTPRQKAKKREGLVAARRKEYEERLRRLATLKSADGLTGEDLRIWKLFESIQEPDKFAAAARRARVRFQLGQRDRFVLGLYYSGRYIREMERIFRDAGLPIELTRLPFVESSFNIFARSKVGASGVWQFMRRTARPYMLVNNQVDERDDPIESTRASARMLKANHQMLGAWPLAVTGYNHGPNGVARIVKKTGTRDLTEIINRYSSRTFGFASENFYACFLAALEVEKDARRYFGDVKWSTAFDGVEIQVSRPIVHRALLEWYDGDESMARLHNFHLKTPVLKGRVPIPRGTFIRVPRAKREKALAYMNGTIGLPDQATLLGDRNLKRSAESAAAAHSVSGPTLAADRAEGRRHRVRSGESLWTISRDYGVSLKELKDVNDLNDRSVLRQGQWLEIPD